MTIRTSRRKHVTVETEYEKERFTENAETASQKQNTHEMKFRDKSSWA